jgi:hypothetical protein
MTATLTLNLTWMNPTFFDCSDEKTESGNGGGASH